MSNKRTRFTKITRIDPKQLNWLKEHKDCRTVAGFLDKIINTYKENSLKIYVNETLRQLSRK